MSPSCLLCGHLELNHEIGVLTGNVSHAKCLMCSCPLFIAASDPDTCRVCDCARQEHGLSGRCRTHPACLEFSGLKLRRSTLSKLNQLVMTLRVNQSFDATGDPLYEIALALIRYEDGRQR